MARYLEVEPAAINAVREVEAGGRGFQGKRPRILFEGQVFYRRLKKYGVAPEQHVAGNEDILYSGWNASTRNYYRANQHARFKTAGKINTTRNWRRPISDIAIA